MAELSDLSVRWQLFVRAYPWRRIDPVPFAPLRKPLSECRVALVSSAGFVVRGQEPFDQHRLGGDPTFREIPADVDAASLVDAHRSEAFDHTGMLRDPNLAFPIDRVREIAAKGRIGSVNHRHLSFMGSLTATGRLTKHTAPRAAEMLAEDAVNVALLVPV
ncbi:MAG: glycine/sarcosine/betaine reductase selenoprotein B family protein [Gemmatimonadales bacterium]|nr:glycine/sarcosine/betaine reductase selenoprotein B family protein [Gemmatimonadales bacterium]